MARWAALILLTLGLFGLLFYRIDLGKFAHAMRMADLRYLALAAFIALFICIGSCILRLSVLVAPLPHTGRAISLSELASLHVASCAAHNLLPAPAGEVVRTVHLCRAHGYALGAVVAAHLLEKVIESLGLGTEALLVALLTPMPRALSTSVYAFAIVGTLGAALVFLVAWRFDREAQSAAVIGARGAETVTSPAAPGTGALLKLRRSARAFVSRLAEGIHLLHSPGIWLRSLALSVTADVGNAATVALCAAAVGVSVPPGAWFLTLIASRLAGVVPSTPGQFGVFEASVVLALTPFSVDQSKALAIGILFHAVHFLPVTLIGVLRLRPLWR